MRIIAYAMRQPEQQQRPENTGSRTTREIHFVLDPYSLRAVHLRDRSQHCLCILATISSMAPALLVTQRALHAYAPRPLEEYDGTCVALRGSLDFRVCDSAWIPCRSRPYLLIQVDAAFQKQLHLEHCI